MKRSIFLISLIMLMFLSLSAGIQCAQNPNPVEGFGTFNGKQLVIGVVANELESEWVSTVMLYAKKLIIDSGAECIATNANNDPAKQVSQMEDLLTRGVDAVIISTVDSNALAPIAEKFYSQGIYIVTVDKVINSDKIALHVAPDQVMMGVKAAKCINDILGGKEGKLVELQGSPQHSVAIARREGFAKGVAKYPNLKIVREYNTEWMASNAMNAVMDVLQIYPDVSGFYLHSDMLIPGVVQGLKQMNRLAPVGDPKHIIIVSTDGSPVCIENINNGNIDAAVENNAMLVADIAVRGILKYIIPGKDHPREVIIDPAVITKVNANDTTRWGLYNPANVSNWPYLEQEFLP
jgi:ribose transport system substrate-binding protein